jgi:hypothetical protein
VLGLVQSEPCKSVLTFRSSLSPSPPGAGPSSEPPAPSRRARPDCPAPMYRRQAAKALMSHQAESHGQYIEREYMSAPSGEAPRRPFASPPNAAPRAPRPSVGCRPHAQPHPPLLLKRVYSSGDGNSLTRGLSLSSSSSKRARRSVANWRADIAGSALEGEHPSDVRTGLVRRSIRGR